MKAAKNTKSGIKRLSLIAILLLSTFTISANPLAYVLGADSTGLDVVYVLMGISGISLLLFFPDSNFTSVSKQESIKVKSYSVEDDFSGYHRKVVKKTA